MKRITLILTLLLAYGALDAQQYSFTFRPKDAKDTMLYIGRHYRDELKLVDSARHTPQGYVFKGKQSWEPGIYALVQQDRKKQITDFTIDHSRTFTIEGDATLTPASVKVKGCKDNEMMFAYMATQQAARRESDSLQKNKDQEGMKRLTERMDAYEADMKEKGKDNLYLQLVNQCEPPRVPDDVEDKPLYYRTHYWDKLFGQKTGKLSSNKALIYSPQLFNKVNYFFYGLLYHADSDTINAELDRLMARIGDDTALSRYVLQFIEPRYYRSTKNIGWDAVWCHIAGEYYLKGRCPWLRESEVYLARQNYNRIRQSIIGAHGQELWMADTNQSNNPDDWISSHRFPEKYVILWFWDPDCHHCQEQSEALKVLYDSLQTAPDRRFEIYAVGYESDVPKWKKYIKAHNFKWVNVGGTNVNIDYQEAYNVHSAPTMIILNEKRDIIMNKVIPAKSLIPFLENYEKQKK